MASRQSASLRLLGQALFFGLLACLSPIVASAQGSNTCIASVPSICVFNSGGQGTYVAGSGFFMDGSNGSSASILNLLEEGTDQVKGTNLGTLSLSTGVFTPLTTKGFGGDGTFGNGTLSIVNTTNFEGFSGTLFTGSLTNISWVALGQNKQNGDYTYELLGTLTGTFEGKTPIGGTTAQMYFQSKTPWTGKGPISLGAGSSQFVVPEPASMSLMGTGLMGLAFLVRKRLKTS